jgi:tetratricopeptide (TPR) repeat protein
VEVLIILGRLRDAYEIDLQAAARGIDDPVVHLQIFDLAYVLNDGSRLAVEQRWARGRPDEATFIAREAEILASAGRMAEARSVRRRAIALAETTNKPEALRIRARGAFIDAAIGDERGARDAVAGIPSTGMSAATIDAAAAAVLARDRQQAHRFLRLPTAGLPTIGRSLVETTAALLEIESGNRDALARVPPPAHGDVIPYGPALRPIYMRGVAYLRGGAAAQAVDEFQRIVDRPGTAPTLPFHALARLQQARAHAAAGNPSKARRSYEEFFERWKDADPDVPVLKEARAEYSRLPR